MAEYGIYINIGTLLSVVLASSSIVWKFSQIEKENREWTEALIDNIKRDLSEVERGGIQRAEDLRQEAGEMGHALRTKIHDVETWNRDNFVRRESFELVIDKLEKSIEKVDSSIGKLADRIEAKLDRMQSGGH